MSAGNQLFHVVVDNDDVATRITALLTEQRAGRVTFIPLNRINPQAVQYPDFGDDALPLVNKINCAEQHQKAVAQAGFWPLFCRVIAKASIRKNDLHPRRCTCRHCMLGSMRAGQPAVKGLVPTALEMHHPSNLQGGPQRV